MVKHTICAISTGPHTHLDHLAPLCEALNIPLLVTEPDHKTLAQQYYPMVETRYHPLEELHLEFLATWQIIITTCKFWAMELRPTLELFQGKTVRFVFTPHGYSDKEEFLGVPVAQDINLVYGRAMKRMQRNQNTIETGNLRYPFYLRYKEHFDRLASPFFRSDKPTVLYAPTWESRAAPSSFFDSIERVVQTLSRDYHLLVKLHPFLEENNPALYHRLIGLYQEQAQFIECFPPVYPLLERVAFYLGDHSSIGYDFLLYDRPMFFLKEGGALSGCGKPFGTDLKDPQIELSCVRRGRYQEVFKAPPLSGAELLDAIISVRDL